MYKVIKENFNEAVNVILMLIGERYNIEEKYNIYDGYAQRVEDEEGEPSIFSLFS